MRRWARSQETWPAPNAREIAAADHLGEQVDKDGDNPKGCGGEREQEKTIVHFSQAVRTGAARRFGRTDLDGNERDDDLLEALGVAGGDGLLEKLEHVLEDLNARVEQIDALWDLEIGPRGVVERLQVRVRLCRRR